MTEEKRVFGMTLKEVEQIKIAIDGWTDNNYHQKSKSEDDCFATAFREGSKLLRSDKTFLHVLQRDNQD